MGEHIVITELATLRWLHILAMVYWLGGEWGIFQTSYNVVNTKLSVDERKRHMETAYRIDILSRTGIIMLLPLGLHMGHLWGLQPYGGAWLVVMWALFFVWLAVVLGAFIYRNDARGVTITKADDVFRYFLIPAMFISGFASLLGHGPFVAGEGQYWYSSKLMMFSLILIIGLYLRYVMRRWTELFWQLEKESAEDKIEGIEAQLDRSIRAARKLAYVYWVSIATMGFLGAAKPF